MMAAEEKPAGAFGGEIKEASQDETDSGGDQNRLSAQIISQSRGVAAKQKAHESMNERDGGI
jgi:hypothetical protein